jgi:hypothetical protein
MPRRWLESAERAAAEARAAKAREKRAAELRAQIGAIESAHAAVAGPIEKFIVALKAAPTVFQAGECGLFLEALVPQIENSVRAAHAELEAQIAIELVPPPASVLLPQSERAWSDESRRVPELRAPTGGTVDAPRYD